MKKLLALLAVMFLTVVANAGMIVTKLSLDGAGTINSTDGYNSTSSPGVGIDAEYLSKVQEINNLTFGFGLEYQFPRAATEGGYFGFMPLYLTGQYTLCNKCCYKPYLKINLGYDLVFNGDSNFKYDNSGVLNGGVYYAFGVGSNIYKDTVVAELMYSTYCGAWNAISNTTPPEIYISNNTYSVLALKVGYCFDLDGCCGK